METNISTTRSQSERLLRCGVSAATADMRRTKNSPEAIPCNCIDSEWLLASETNSIELDLCGLSLSHAWSLNALLELLPKRLDGFPFTKWIQSDYLGEICELNSEGVINGDVKLYHNGSKWIVDYDWDGFLGVLPQSESPIEACVRAIELLYVNGYNFNQI